MKTILFVLQYARNYLRTLSITVVSLLQLQAEPQWALVRARRDRATALAR